MQEIIEEYTKLASVDSTIVKSFLDLGLKKQFKSKDIVLPFGATEKKIFLVVRGILRTYIKEGNDEINKVFYFKGELASILSINLLGEKSKEAIDCLTDVELLELDYDDLLKLCEENSKVAYLKNKLMERKYIELETRVVDLISKNASQRYAELVEKYKNIDYYVSQYHIASYLGISPIQLSRIRKKLFRTI